MCTLLSLGLLLLLLFLLVIMLLEKQMKQHPELLHYRDIILHWKYFLNTSNSAFPASGRLSSLSAQLSCVWDRESGSYVVQICGRGFNCYAEAGANRFQSLATALQPESEDDLLYKETLHSFSARNALQTMSQRDTELLLSFLTVPYLRLQLVLNFFSSEDQRIQTLSCDELRELFDAVMFEPGRYLKMNCECLDLL